MEFRQPLTAHRDALSRRLGRVAPRQLRRWVLLAVGCLVMGLPQTIGSRELENEASGETLTIRLRTSWGGGPATIWHGSFRVKNGELTEATSLGLDSDGPASQYLHHDSLIVEPVLPRTYDGCEFTVTGPPDAELVWTLYDAQRSSVKQTQSIPLAELARQAGGFPLDQQGNRLYIQRAPGDDLRVEFDREHLVFSPGETFQFELQPTLTAAPPGTSLNCEVSMRPARSDAVVWTWKGSFEFDDMGTAPSETLTVPMPDDVGAYTLVIVLEGKRLARPLVRPKAIARREIDVVVAPATSKELAVAAETFPAETAVVPWKPRMELDPTAPGWMDRIRQLDQLNLVSRFYSGPLGSGPIQTESLQGSTLVRIDPGQWQAFPLSIQDKFNPHLLEVELLPSQSQRLAISIVEPSATQNSSAVQVDSGIVVRRQAGTTPTNGEWLFHRLVFWPNTRAPWVVLTNPDPVQPAYFRIVRVYDGPTTLAEATPMLGADESSESSHNKAATIQLPTRLIGPYLEKPTLQENLQVTKLFENGSNQGIDDWYSFDLMASRLVEYLDYAGFNSAQLTVVADGSGWYPSELLRPTPKYDSGVFSLEGRDPVRKDVVELLMRHFDAAGLRLVPVLDITGPIPALESIRREQPEVILDQWNERGQSRFQERLAVGRLTGFYQPLNTPVREALADIARECTQRYSHHDAWGGLGMRIGPGSHLYLADGRWGLDPTNLAEFREWLEQQNRAPASLTAADCVYGTYREPWLRWRNSKYVETLKALQQAVTAEANDSRLYLVGIDWLQNSEMTRKLHPSVRGQEFYGDAAWQEVGFDAKQLAQLERTIVLPGRGQTSLWSRASRRVERIMFEDDEIANFLARLDQHGALLHRTPAMLTVPKLAQLTSSGTQQDGAKIQPEFSPIAAANRSRFIEALAQGDCQAIFDGGWGLALGQEAETSRLVHSFGMLPAAKFTTVRDVNAKSNAVPLIVRQAVVEDQTWWYMINPSPWPVAVKGEAISQANATLESLDAHRLTIESRSGEAVRFAMNLQPFDLAVLKSGDSKAAIQLLQASVPQETSRQIESDLNEFFGYVTKLGKEPQPLPSLNNAEFEAAATARSIPGWVFGQGAGVSVQILDGSYDGGAQSLKIRSQGPVAWVRSSPFALPKSGRLSLLVWLRTDRPESQPALRLALEAKCAEGEYYQFAKIGSLAPANQPQPIGDQWKPFAVHFDDLPQEGVLELRVGFDLMEAGEVQVDHVETFDRWFDQQDQRVMLQRVSAARHQLQQGNLYEPYQFLESYWARLLMDHDPLELLDSSVESSDESAPRTARENRSMLDRVKTWVPTPSLPFR